MSKDKIVTAKEVVEQKLYEKYNLEVVIADPEAYTGGYFNGENGEEAWFKHRGMARVGVIYNDFESRDTDDDWVRLLTGDRESGIGTYDVGTYNEDVRFKLIPKQSNDDLTKDQKSKCCNAKIKEECGEDFGTPEDIKSC